MCEYTIVIIVRSIEHKNVSSIKFYFGRFCFYFPFIPWKFKGMDWYTAMPISIYGKFLLVNFDFEDLHHTEYEYCTQDNQEEYEGIESFLKLFHNVGIGMRIHHQKMCTWF